MMKEKTMPVWGLRVTFTYSSKHPEDCVTADSKEAQTRAATDTTETAAKGISVGAATTGGAASGVGVEPAFGCPVVAYKPTATPLLCSPGTRQVWVLHLHS